MHHVENVKIQIQKKTVYHKENKGQICRKKGEVKIEWTILPILLINNLKFKVLKKAVLNNTKSKLKTL